MGHKRREEGRAGPWVPAGSGPRRGKESAGCGEGKEKVRGSASF